MTTMRTTVNAEQGKDLIISLQGRLEEAQAIVKKYELGNHFLLTEMLKRYRKGWFARESKLKGTREETWQFLFIKYYNYDYDKLLEDKFPDENNPGGDLDNAERIIRYTKKYIEDLTSCFACGSIVEIIDTVTAVNIQRIIKGNLNTW